MKIVQEIGAQVKWAVASVRNDVMGLAVIGIVAAVAVKLIVF